MPRIFLSHSSKDNVAAVAIADWLKEEGWDDAFLDLDPVQGIHPGERWERALYTQAADCEAVLFLVSRNWLASEWCRREFDLARKLNKRCFVILIEQIPIDELPLFLKETHQAVSLATGGDHQVFRPKMPVTHEEGYITFSAEGLARLKLGLEHAGLDPRFFAWPPANEPDRVPYRGLEPLDSVDAGVFFGRDAPIIEALDVLRGLREATPPRLFVILGASGAGKSSFLRAGLLPRLSRDDRNFLALPVIRPERAAISGPTGFIASVADAIVRHGLTTTRAQIRQAAAEGVAALRPILKSLLTHALEKTAPTILLTIDQAEELFRAEAGEEGDAFLRLIHDLAAADDPAVIVIFSIRSDSYDALQRAKALEGQKQHTFALLPMPHGAYQTVIEGPLRRLRQAGRKFEVDPALTEAVLEDIEQGGGSDALPLLSFTMELLYRDHEAARHISRDDYLDFGGLKGAIEAALKRAFALADLDPRIPKDYDARLALLRRGFIPWLAGIDPDTKSLRRRVARASQIPIEARPLIDLLVEQRLLTCDVDKETGEATVEPAHEALLRQWGGLKGWLEEDFGCLATLEGVKRAAMDWDANARAPAWVAHGGARLSEADQLELRPDLAALLNPADRAYLAACRQKENTLRETEEKQRRTEADLAREKHDALVQRERYSRRIAIGSLAGVAIFAVVAFWALHERRIADEQRAIAEEQRTIAEKQLVAATETANKLVLGIVQNIKDMSGVPSVIVLGILDVAHDLQEQLTASGFKTADLKRSHALSREETVPICLDLGKTTCALVAATEAVELRKPLSDADPSNAELKMELARSYSRMGQVKKALGDLPGALKLYGDALAIAQSVATGDPKNDAWRHDLSQSYENVGDVLLAEAQLDAAFDAYRTALRDREAIVAIDAKHLDWRRDLARNHAKLGAVLFEQNDRVGANKAYRDGLTIIEALSRENPRNAQLRQDLSEGYEKIGDIEFALNKTDAALAAYRDSFAIRQALVDSDPAKAQWRRSLAQSYNKIGDVQLARNDLAEAAKSYALGLSIARTLATADEANEIAQLDLSKSLSKVGDVRLAQGDLAGALASYRDSLAIMESRPPAAANGLRWRQDIAKLNEFIGTILFNQKDYAGALAAFQRMLEATQDLAKAYPNEAGFQFAVVSARKKLAIVDKAKIGVHLDAARSVLQAMAAKLGPEDYDLRRQIDYAETQLSNGRIDLYNLIGRHARFAKR